MNPYDKEYMKMAMLKHEEAFREQVYELHRLYRIQKILMKDTARSRGGYGRSHGPSGNRAEAQLRLDLEGPATEDDQAGDLELTLGTRSYSSSRRKIIPGRLTDSGPSFSSSSSGSNHIKRSIRSSARDELAWGLDQTPLSSSQDKLNIPPWLFQAFSLNMT